MKTGSIEYTGNDASETEEGMSDTDERADNEEEDEQEVENGDKDDEDDEEYHVAMEY